MSEDTYPHISEHTGFPEVVTVRRVAWPHRSVLVEFTEGDFTGSVILPPDAAIQLGRDLIKHGGIAKRKAQADLQ